MKYYVKKRRLEYREDQPEDVSLDLVKRKYLRFWAKKEVREQCHLENIHVEIKDVLGVLKKEGIQQSEG